MSLPLVMIESPLKGDVARNVAYARACMRDSLARGEAPFAMHLLYAQDGILDDTKPEERTKGIAAGLAWSAKADLVAVYCDHGISEGMNLAIKAAEARGCPVVYRTSRLSGALPKTEHA